MLWRRTPTSQQSLLAAQWNPGCVGRGVRLGSENSSGAAGAGGGVWKSGGHFSGKKRRLRQRTHKFRASRNPGAIFLEKKGACGNVPTSSGLPEIWGPFFWKKKAPAATYPQTGLPEIWGPFFLKKKRRLRQRTHKFRASMNLGAIFLEKKSACGNVPTS